MSRNYITKYFNVSKSTNTAPLAISCVENTNSVDSFYKKCLKEQIKTSSESCHIDTCLKEKRQLEKILEEKKEKLQEIQKAVDTCKRICSKKDEQIKNLKTKSSQKSPSKPSMCAKPKVLFQEFSTHFDDDQLSELRSFKSHCTTDSTFINFVIRQLYAKDLNKLNGITVSGRRKVGEQKGKMSPTKQKLIGDVFDERLNNMEANSESRMARRKKFNEHVKNAINNIRRGTKRNTELVKVNLPQ